MSGTLGGSGTAILQGILKKGGDKLGVGYDFSSVNVKNDDLEQLVLKKCLYY